MMAGDTRVKWAAGRDLRALGPRLEKRREEVRAGLNEALERTVEIGAVATQDKLEAAVTRTGRRREEEEGGFPGRHDTGNMVGSVSYDVEDQTQRRVWGRFGWWGANYEAYFRDQDLGEGKIPAARALPEAFVQAREYFREQVRRVMRGRAPE